MKLTPAAPAETADARRLSIRSWHLDDARALVKHANSRQVSRYLRDAFPYPYTRRDARRWIRHATTQAPQTHFAIAAGDEAVGGIGLRLQDDIFRCSAEIGYWLGEACWGQGIATWAVRVMVEHAFNELGLVRVWAHVLTDNVASARVLEKASFVREGRLRRAVIKHGKIHDQWLYARISEGGAPPPSRKPTDKPEG